MTPFVVRSLAGLAVAGAVAAAAVLFAPPEPWRGLFAERSPAVAAVPIGGPFTLRDGDGRMRSDEMFRGAPMLVSFGYTSCPDICPTTLQVMTNALEAVGPKGEAIQPLFITVDPERDTPEVMRAYVGLFHQRLIGLTGTTEQTAAAADSYRVFARKTEGGEEGYLVDHTALVYLMGPDGAYVTHFHHRTDSETMAAKLSEYMDSLS